MKRRSAPKIRNPRSGPSTYASKLAQRSAMGAGFNEARKASPDWRPRGRER